MHVYESNNIRVSGYPLPLKLKIVDDLTIDNPAYLKAKYQRRPTWGIDQKLQLFTYDNDGSLILPRGYADRLYNLIPETTASVKWDKEQVEGEPVDFGPWNENFQIRDYQHPLIDSLLRKNGIGVSPAGSGKTIMGMRYIYEVGRPTLWLTHTRDLVYQTRDRALSTLKGVGRVGILGDGVEDFGDRKLIIATVQTLKAKQRLVEKLKEFIGVVVIDEAAPSHGPVAASSLIQQRRLIIAALEYAVDKGRINRNPGKKTRRPKSKPKTNNILTDEEMETLGIKGTKYRYYPAYMLTLTTACRRGEILGLDWQHVDIGIPWTTVDRYFPWGDIKKLPKWDTKALKTLLEDHNITLGDGYLRLVYQMVDDNGTPFRDELKTDLSRRSLMITEEMVLLLIFWRLIQNTEKRKATERGIEYNPDNLVFCTRKGTYIYPRNFTKMWSENLRSMGIDHKRFHDLRHTVATVMLEDGEAMNTVQEQLGHYDAGFTASRYGHVTAKMRNSAAVKLGERLEKVRNPEAEDEEDANSVKKEDTVIPFQEGRKLKSAACKIK